MKIEQSPVGANSWTTASTGAIAVNAATATVTGLSAATSYDFRLVVTGGANAGSSNTVSVTTNAALTYTVATITDQTTSALIQGYASGTQETKSINITNTGTGDLTNLSVELSGTNADDFVISQPASPLNSGSPAANFTVKVKDGLAAGTYTATVTISADHMTDQMFTVTQVVNLPDAPANPQNLVASGGDEQIVLNWGTATEATYYNLYMSTTSGEFSTIPDATVTQTTYNFQNLINGTTYYFKVKAGNLGGLSGESNSASATPATVPGAPTNVSAVAGNGQAIISFSAPADNGGSAITGYEVIASPGNILMTGSASPIIITGLTNGTSYTFTVKAINGEGSSASSGASNAIIPISPTGGSTDPVPVPTTPPQSGTGVDVLVNGKVENAGTATTSSRNDQSVTTIAIDQKKLDDKLAVEGQGAVVTIPVNANSDIVVGELNGQMIKNMENKQAVLEIKTDRATYILPAQQINIDSISNQFGRTVALQDIKLQIEIAVPTAETLKKVGDAATKGSFTLVAPPIDFTVKATNAGTTVEVSKFNAYVERIIALPDGVDPNKITTGVVVDPDGTVRHVPTKIVVIDGKYYAKVNSLTNSTYSVVWHPLEFSDVSNHWAKDAVNNMGSRMVIEGTGNSMFSPDQDVTRAEFAAIIVRGLGLKLESGTSVFSDVLAADWYSSVINTAKIYHLIDGFEDGTFRPNDKITREQAMAIIAKAMTITNLKAKISAPSTDAALERYIDMAKVSTWARSAIADSVQAGLVSGRSSTELAPKDYMTRAEVAAIVERLLRKSDLI
ncbi:MAG: S-layer homology domain-containing protein [Paenibacillus sp.]|nr:S-layer homology domain-containing protein [Paenibacillus sp.]